MSQDIFLKILTYAEAFGYISALAAILLRGQLRRFAFIAAFLAARLLSSTACTVIMRMGGHEIEVHRAYAMYFYTYWVSYTLEAILGFGIIYSLYRLAMAPLPGLQRLGMIMFRWAAGISLAVAMTSALGPHTTGLAFITRLVMQIQQTQSILTLCMLLFVCMTIRPMGISHQSKIFGVCLGLGVLATVDLAESAWLAVVKSMNSNYNVINGIAICITLAIWTTYFALPEPKRRMIILPTTSPFLRWNQISLALGDEPGYVSIGDFHPDMLAPAEVEIMRRASAKMISLRVQ